MYAECQLEEHEEGTRGKIYELLENPDVCDFFRVSNLLLLFFFVVRMTEKSLSTVVIVALLKREFF